MTLEHQHALVLELSHEARDGQAAHTGTDDDEIKVLLVRSHATSVPAGAVYWPAGAGDNCADVSAFGGSVDDIPLNTNFCTRAPGATSPV